MPLDIVPGPRPVDTNVAYWPRSDSDGRRAANEFWRASSAAMTPTWPHAARSQGQKPSHGAGRSASGTGSPASRQAFVKAANCASVMRSRTTRARAASAAPIRRAIHTNAHVHWARRDRFRFVLALLANGSLVLIGTLAHVLVADDNLARMATLRTELATAEEREPTHAVASADKVIAKLRALPERWAMATPDGRAELLNAIYERIVVRGPEFISARLTPDAYAMGLALALRDAVMARPTGVGHALAHLGFRQILIEGADEWRSAALESA